MNRYAGTVAGCPASQQDDEFHQGIDHRLMFRMQHDLTGPTRPRGYVAQTVVVAVALFGFLQACHLDPSKALRPIEVKANPAAHRGKALEFRFSGLPGAVRLSGAELHFEIQNRECVPMDYGRAWGGVRLPPRYGLPTPVSLASDGALIVDVPKDALIDEDYFGLGPCHWALQSVSLPFASQRARFVASVSADEILTGKDLVLQYLVSDYTSGAEHLPVIFGERAGFYPNGKAQFSLKVIVRAGED